MTSDYLSTGAVFSEDQRYRYLLWRAWDRFDHRDGMITSDRRVVAFCGLNPSTADAHKPDPTITREINFAKAWGFAGLLKVNRFGLVSTDPKGLRTGVDAVGGDNEYWKRKAFALADMIVCAWGAGGPERGVYGESLTEANRQALEEQFPGKVHHLGLTKDGHPKHPLYLRGDTRPQRWTP